MAKERRSRKEVLIVKIEDAEKKIVNYTKRIEELNAERSECEKELAEINDAEAKATEETKMKEIAKLIKNNNISLDELKHLIENRTEETK